MYEEIHNVIKSLEGKLNLKFNCLLDEMKKELIGREMSFIELDKKMVKFGFYSVADDEIEKDIQRDKNIYYLYNDEDIVFAVLIEISPFCEDEDGIFYVKIISIKRKI